MLTHEYPNTWVVHSTKTYSLASAQASCENAKTQKRKNAKTRKRKNAKTQKRKNAHKDPAVFLQHGESQFVIISVMPTVIGNPTSEV